MSKGKSTTTAEIPEYQKQQAERAISSW